MLNDVFWACAVS